jgi:hypothetical protein
MYALLAYIVVGLLYVAVIGAFIISIEPIATHIPGAVAPILIPALLFALMYACFRLWQAVPTVLARVKVPVRHRYPSELTVLAGLYRRPAKSIQLGWPAAEFKPGGILIARYPFRHSSVFPGDCFIPVSRMTSTFASTDTAIVLDGKEIIFLPAELKEPLATFAVAHGLSAPPHREVWSILADPFIDQPYTEQDEQRDLQQLEAHGVTAQESNRLRAMISGTMLAATFFSMEWCEYTTQDVLRAFALAQPQRFTAEFYWLVMEAALRPYRKGSG